LGSEKENRSQSPVTSGYTVNCGTNSFWQESTYWRMLDYSQDHTGVGLLVTRLVEPRLVSLSS